MEKAIECITKKYADFSGRASRSEFWIFVLFVFIVSFVLGLIENFTGVVDKNMVHWIKGLFSLATMVPSLAVTTRRLHDIDKSGWWQLINYISGFIIFNSLFAFAYHFYPIGIVISVLIAIIAVIWMLVWLCTKGTEGSNRFGDDPLQQ